MSVGSQRSDSTNHRWLYYVILYKGLEHLWILVFGGILEPSPPDQGMTVLPFCCGLVAKSCPTLCNPMDWSSPGSLPFPWDFPGKNTGVGCHFLLQGIFPTQRLNPHLLHWQADSLPLSHLGSPYLEGSEIYRYSICIQLTWSYSWFPN